MKRIYLALLLVLTLCSAAFALSDKDYLRLKRNSKNFARADAELSEVYEEIKDTLSAREFERVKREQRNWIRTGRDAYAKKRMRAGDSRSEAYTEATLARVQELRERYLDEEPEAEPRPIIRNDQKVRIPDTNPRPMPEPEPEPEPERPSRSSNAGLTVEDIQGIYKNHAGTVMKISYLGEVDDNEMQVNFDADDGESHERWTSRGVLEGTKIELDTEDNGAAILTFKNSSTVNVKVDDSFRANGFFSDEVCKTVEGTYDKQ